MGIIPDKIINLNITKETSFEYIKEFVTTRDRNHNFIPVADRLSKEAGGEIAERVFMEYEINMNAVAETYSQFIYNVDSVMNSNETSAIIDDLTRMLRIRHRNNAPRVPPKIMLIGPPGSGRSTQANKIADAFGLVCISPYKILLAEAERNPPIKIKLREAAENG